MADEEAKALPPAMSATRAGSEDKVYQPYQTAADMLNIYQEGKPTLGRSASPGLVEVPNSQVPGLGNGGMISHVMGPQQNPCDPIAAGLDLNFNPKTRHELRAVTKTGEDGAGPGPSTYAEKADGTLPQQRTEATHEIVPPAPEVPVELDHVTAAQEAAKTGD